MDPLSRSFPLSLFLRLPHSPLPRFADMQDHSTALLTTAPRPLQSIAALLPTEIVDCIFSHFHFDERVEEEADLVELERTGNLDNMSVIAEKWTGPARRLLFRNRRVKSWADGTSEVGGIAGGYVRNMTLAWSGFYEGEDEAGASVASSAISNLFKNLTNLRRLAIINLPITSLDDADSHSLRTTSFPYLSHVHISSNPFPHSIVSDLLASHDHQISQVTLLGSPHHYETCHGKLLDFQGKLRYLDVNAYAYRMMVDSSRVVLDSLKGLEHLDMASYDDDDRDGREELFRVIAPTLEILTITSGDTTLVSELFPHFLRLSQLTLLDVDHDHHPALLRLPASLSFLRLSNDIELAEVLLRWIAEPSLVPKGLKHIQIDCVYDKTNLQHLPTLDTFSTTYSYWTSELLSVIEVGSLPFATLDMSFEQEEQDGVELVREECKRLAVKFQHDLVTLD